MFFAVRISNLSYRQALKANRFVLKLVWSSEIELIVSCYFFKSFKIFTLKFLSRLVTACTKFWYTSSMVTTDIKITLFFYLVTTETKKGQRDFFRQLLIPRTKLKRRLSFSTQRDYLRDLILMGNFFEVFFRAFERGNDFWGDVWNLWQSSLVASATKKKWAPSWSADVWDPWKISSSGDVCKQPRKMSCWGFFMMNSLMTFAAFLASAEVVFSCVCFLFLLVEWHFYLSWGVMSPSLFKKIPFQAVDNVFLITEVGLQILCNETYILDLFGCSYLVATSCQMFYGKE